MKKKYTAFLVLLGSTCVQKLRQFEFLTLAIKISFLFDFCTDVLLIKLFVPKLRIPVLNLLTTCAKLKVKNSTNPQNTSDSSSESLKTVISYSRHQNFN